MRGPWQPIAAGALARRIRARVEELLARPAADDDEPWTALLHAQADRSAHAARIDAILDRAVAAVGRGVRSPALYGGFTGVAWLVSHLGEDPDACGEVDEALHELLGRSPWPLSFDLMRGLVGIGVYFLERQAPAGLELVVERLAELATETGDGVTWLSDGHRDHGVAHGVAGIIGLLARARGSRARELLARAVSALLAQRRPGGPPFFASTSLDEGSRLAWCYGDLGIAAMLLGAPGWEETAATLAGQAAGWRDASTRVSDAGLCHGSAGVAHIFHRFFQATGDATFRDAALWWYRRTLELPPQRHPGFLIGATGTGLALLAAIEDREPGWDRLLLLST